VSGSLVALIKQCGFFSALPEEDIIKLLPRFEKMILSKDETLFKLGDQPDHLYILTRGNLISSLFINDEEQTIGIINTFETVGELGVISQEPRTLTVKALTNCELLKMTSAVFLEFCETIPGMAAHIMKLVTRRARKTIQLFDAKTLHKFIIIFAPNKNVRLNDFQNSIIESVSKDKFFILPTEMMQAGEYNKLLQLIMTKDMDTHIVVFLEKYHMDFFSLFGRQSTRFFLVAQNNKDLTVDSDAEEIITYIKKSHYRFELILLHKSDRIPANWARQWLLKYDFDLHHHIRLNNLLDYERLERFFSKTAVGLVLSGGGIKGFAQLGMIRALIENNIPIDMIAGCSSGAIAAACYAYTMDHTRAIEMYTLLIHSMTASLSKRSLTWPVISLFNGGVVTRKLEETFGALNIEDLCIPFFCVSSNITACEEVVHRMRSLSFALRCSAALPGIWPMVAIDGKLHGDGGIFNNLPVDIMRKLLGDENEIFALQVSTLEKKPPHYNFPSVINLKDILLFKLGLSHKDYKFPSFLEVLSSAALSGSVRREAENTALADCTIRPDVSGISLLKLKKDQSYESIIELGYQAAMSEIAKYKKLKVKKDDL
jgi:NTE family protein